MTDFFIDLDLSNLLLGKLEFENHSCESKTQSYQLNARNT